MGELRDSSLLSIHRRLGVPETEDRGQMEFLAGFR